MQSMSKIDLNSKYSIGKRVESGQITWHWPTLIVFSRLIFAAITQGLIALLFFKSSPSPLDAAGNWWPVYGTLIDLSCFILISRLLKKEGLRFYDLLNFNQDLFWKDVTKGLGFILWVFPLAMAGIIACSLLIFSNPQPPSIYHPLTQWANVYSLLIFPVVWGVMEQATYQGYALPRLEALFRNPGLAIFIVAFGWGIQHIALPLMIDWKFMLFRFLSFLPLASVMALVYLKKRRLIPFIIAYWAVDFLGVISGIIIPILIK